MSKSNRNFVFGVATGVIVYHLYSVGKAKPMGTSA